MALAALKNDATISELSSRYSVHPNLVRLWKSKLLSESEEIFSDKRKRKKVKEEKLKDELFRQIGQLKVELDWLKKKSGISG